MVTEQPVLVQKTPITKIAAKKKAIKKKLPSKEKPSPVKITAVEPHNNHEYDEFFRELSELTRKEYK